MTSMSSHVNPPRSRQNAIACSGSSQVENATGVLPCLRRLKRSSSAAATISPSTTIAAAGSWKTALIPRTFMATLTSEKTPLTKPCPIVSWTGRQIRDRGLVLSGGVVLLQPLDALAQKPRHVHLRDAEALADLALHEVLLEAQPQGGLLTRGQD